MSDLISRQAAIDILDAYQVMVENGEENPYTWARLRMSEVPSAQPEIVRCKDCKLFGNSEQLPSAQPERKKGHWIEVDDHYNRISGRCSVCGWESHMYEDDVVGMDFCPNCGGEIAGR